MTSFFIKYSETQNAWSTPRIGVFYSFWDLALQGCSTGPIPRVHIGFGLAWFGYALVSVGLLLVSVGILLVSVGLLLVFVGPLLVSVGLLLVSIGQGLVWDLVYLGPAEIEFSIAVPYLIGQITWVWWSLPDLDILLPNSVPRVQQGVCWILHYISIKNLHLGCR